ncbi:MAG: CopG family transcriptional regulator [Promethearchaeota archaeon]|nr:MAG: CopG family transcriptional regulator [Candidatus Lokiarchaeota archaeon]
MYINEKDVNILENNKNSNKINRITIALDDKTDEVLNELKNGSHKSQSELIRKSIRFYHQFKKVFNHSKKGAANRVDTYLELLSNGEHIILDIDHYLSFLSFIENSPNSDQYWEMNKSIGKAHAEEFLEEMDLPTVRKVVERLEACNFFKMVKDSSNRYTLLLGSDIQKKFIKSFLEEVFQGMGFKALIKEGFSKLKIILGNASY